MKSVEALLDDSEVLPHGSPRSGAALHHSFLELIEEHANGMPCMLCEGKRYEEFSSYNGRTGIVWGKVMGAVGPFWKAADVIPC